MQKFLEGAPNGLSKLPLIKPIVQPFEEETTRKS